jgi:uncharacterized OB-fold protein
VRMPGNLVARHPAKTCKACGGLYVPLSGRQLYCTHCRLSGAARRYREQTKAEVDKPCA